VISLLAGLFVLPATSPASATVAPSLTSASAQLQPAAVFTTRVRARVTWRGGVVHAGHAHLTGRKTARATVSVLVTVRTTVRATTTISHGGVVLTVSALGHGRATSRAVVVASASRPSITSARVAAATAARTRARAVATVRARRAADTLALSQARVASTRLALTAFTARMSKGRPGLSPAPTSPPAPAPAPVVTPDPTVSPAPVVSPDPTVSPAPVVSPDPTVSPAPVVALAPPVAVTAMSGASGSGAADGTFAAWRGSPLQIGGTWNDSYDAQTAEWSVQPGAEWGSWNADLDVAVGAIYADRGETWAAAAGGAYDARWRTALTNLERAWGSRTGVLHIRFAHEFNGSWTPWAVTGATAPDFVASWKRFRALQKQILPTAMLVFCPNDGSSASQNLDWRKAFPGKAYVDEMSVDSYNQYPFVTTSAGFAAKITSVDSYGAPIGIEMHRRFAASVGLPLAISEWSSNSTMGDGAVFVREMHSWIEKNAGTGPGQVPYEIMFNVAGYNNGAFEMFPATAMPGAAAMYASLF
jgi:hypothetical protein